MIRNAYRSKPERLVLPLMLWLMLAPVAHAQGTVTWTEAIALSEPNPAQGYTNSPAIAADMAGNVHVVWGQVTLTPRLATGADTLVYRRWDGQSWTDPIDVLTSPDEGATEFPELATTPDGMLHAAWSTSGASGKLWYAYAPACCANRATAWSTPQQLDAGILGGTIAMISDSRGRLHIAFAESDTSNIIYRRSDDSGATWSLRVTIPNGATGQDEFATYARLAADGQGRVHAVWSVQPWPGRRVMYARSDDGGDTWNTPTVIDEYDPERYLSAGYGPIWIDVEARGDSEVHLMWDGAPTVERNHVYSTDGGQTWSRPMTVFPEITLVGRNGWNDMAVDSAGTLHAVALIQPWHAQWANGAWSPSSKVANDGHAELMRVAVSLGNELHVVWNRFVPDQAGSVWYARGETNAPRMDAQALPTVPTTRTPAATLPARQTPTASPTPVQVPGDGQPPSTSPDAVTVLLLSTLPALTLVLLVAGVQIRKRRRN